MWKSQIFLVKTALAGANDAIVMTFGPYPGSADWRRLVDEGDVVIDDAYNYVGLLRSSAAVVSFNPRMSGRQLRVAQLTMMVVFYAVASLRRPSAPAGLRAGLEDRSRGDPGRPAAPHQAAASVGAHPSPSSTSDAQEPVAA